MITPEQQNILFYLLTFIGILFILVLGAVLYSALKKPQLPQQAGKPTDDTDQKLPDTSGQKKEVDHVVQKPPPGVPTEKTLKQAMAPTEDHIFGRLRRLFKSDQTEDEVWEQIEEILYTSDMGPLTVDSILTDVKSELSRSEKKNYQNVADAIRSKIESIFEASTFTQESFLKKIQSHEKPFVIMVVGVNGVGKTTTIGKLAAYFAQNELKVLVAAGDTFRAAASDQLRVWSERAKVEIFSPENVKDPSAVAFDAISKSKASNVDVVIIDTAGRLHTQINLMDELKKVKRVMQKILPESPHETLIVLDANSGQNALIQAKQFHEALQITGAVLTKMDGTAKGGVAIGLVSEVRVPIKFIGIGEKVADLREFNQKEFIDSLIQQPSTTETRTLERV